MASNLTTLYTKSLILWSIKMQGISRPPCGKSLEYVLFGSVTSELIVPPFLIKSEQVEFIFFGKGPTIVLAFITSFTAYGS